jgi:hypothetical protein
VREIAPNLLWIEEHPVRLAGGRFSTRMTVLRLERGLCVHSPIPIDAARRAEIEALGEVVAIIAPSTFHHFFFASAQAAFPAARTYAGPGLETKRRDLHFDEVLGPEPPPLWAGEMDQVVVGNRVMREVDFLHRASRSLVAVDLVENFRDETPGTNAVLRMWMRLFGMWGRPRPAPELRLFTFDRRSVREAVDRILAWDFDRAVIAHGELLGSNARDVVREAWRWLR